MQVPPASPTHTHDTRLVDVTTAVCVLETAPTLATLLRKEQRGDVRHEVASREASTPGMRGWILQPSAQPHGPQTHRHVATVIASIVDPSDTPDVVDVALAQLRPYPPSVELARRLQLVSDLFACYHVVEEALKLGTMVTRLQSFMWPVAYIPHMNALARDMLLSYFGVSNVDVSYLHIYETCNRVAFTTHAETLRTMFSLPDARSPNSMMFTILGERASPGSPFACLPRDIVRKIVDAACEDRINALHCELDARARDAGDALSRSYDACRRSLREIVALVVVCSTEYAGILHLRNVRDALQRKAAAVQKLERCVHRGAAKRMRITPLPASLPIPKLNTLVLCDTLISKVLRASPEITAASLVVRHITGLPELSTSIHADILCVNPYSIQTVRGFQFRRCFVCCHPNRFHRPWTSVRADNVWILRSTLMFSHCSYPLPLSESNLLGVENPHIVNIGNSVVIA